jgi:signal transduction histidine kinase
MGNLLRLAVFILALGSLAAGTSLMLLKESERENALERMVFALENDTEASAESTAEAKALLIGKMRQHHTRTQRATLFFGGLALACVIGVAVIPARPPRPVSERDPNSARNEMRGLETLARANVAQRVELDHERDARHRSEQDLHLQQVLANHALQDKVRLGRDLHDGLVQTLYATGLVLETAAQRLAATPPQTDEASRLLARAKTTLNAAIREARSTIGELTPDALEEQSLGDAINAILDHLDGGRLETRDVALAADLPTLTADMRTELLQVLRESASNALRHGSATRLKITFAPLPDQRWQLAISDNGRGFDPAAVTRGHGLDNLAARARNLGGTLEIDAKTGTGATIRLTLPATVSAAAVVV